jgi:hypothetical protein
MSWTDWIVSKVSESSTGFIHIRLGPGFFRTIHNIVTTHGWPVQDSLAVECERLNGLGHGDLSLTGFPKFVKNIWETEDRKHEDKSLKPEIIITGSNFAFSGSSSTDGSKRASDVVADDKYISDDLLTSGPKTAAEDGSIGKLKTLAEGRRIIFLGPSRAAPFARNMGCAAHDFFYIPPEGATQLFDEAKQFLTSRIESPDTRHVVLMHGASWLGNSLALEVGLKLSGVSCAFSSIDLGLSCTLLDLEFLATRPWFIKNSETLLNESKKLSNTGLKPIAPYIKSSDVLSFGVAWKNATSHYQKNQLDAIQILQEGLQRVGTDSEYFSTARATLVLWKYAAGILGNDLGNFENEIFWKAEPALILATVYLAMGHHEEARNYLLAAEIIESCQPYSKYLRELIDNRTNIQFGELEAALHRYGRAYLGSTLAWPLWGDYPGSDTHLIRN